MNSYIVVPKGRSVFVLNAKLYLVNDPDVGEVTDDTNADDNNYIWSAIPIVWNIKFSS